VAPQTVHELTQLTVTNAATNANLHSTITGYTLINAPAGVAISPGGVITWTPAQNQSPGTNLITTVVANHNPFDLVNPQLTATNTFTIIVQEVNQAPVLPLMGPQTLYAQTTLTVTNTAVETNVHATVTYGLVNPPAGLAINASGVITWTPAATQSPGANPVTTVATSTDWLDPVNPLLYATNTFSVTVIPLPVLTPPVNLGGGAFQLSFNTLAHGSYTIEYSTNLTIWNPVNVITGDGSPRTLSLTNAPGDRQGFYRLQVAP
jgi:hypothetical protein